MFLFTFSLGALQANGPLTRSMLQALDAGALIYYDSETGLFFHRGKSFHVLTDANGYLSRMPIVSIGTVPFSRELITLDPDSSPFLEEKYREFLDQLHDLPLDHEVIFWATLSFVKEEVFAYNARSTSELDHFLKKWVSDHQQLGREHFTLTWENAHFPVIPLDDFIQAKRGVCRHLALAVAYFLDKLQNEEELRHLIPAGRTYVVRDFISQRSASGYHAWNLFVSEDGKEAWHIDATWGVLKNVYTESLPLFRLYGKGVIEREKNRFLLSN